MRRFPRLPKSRTNAPHRPTALGRGCSIEALEERAMLALIGQSLFPADNPWNQRIDQAPVAANSATIMNAIVGRYGDGRLHPDFGQDYRDSSSLYGIPYNVVHGNSTTKTHVVIDAYPDESDLEDAPIPAGAVIEGDLQNGPTIGVDIRGDSHLIVWDADNNVAYEFYRASRPTENSDGKWHADGESVWDMKTNTFRTLGWTSADAAGLAILPGLVRPDEGLPTSEGGQGAINHAIRFTLQNAVILNQFLYPASHVANPGNNSPTTQPPMGARFRLKASVDISSLDPESRVIAQAMKSYGMIVADNGSNFFFSGASYAVDSSNHNALTWNDDDIQDSVHGLKSLHYSDFEVVNLTPVVTGLSASAGPAGTQITVTGKNFSGAAGHLQVLFGNTLGTAVSVLDDGHVQATVPAGSGSVDVRVQSGVSDPGDSENINSPIFGYGISATSSADRFTVTAGIASLNSNVLYLYGTGGADTMSLNAAGGSITATVNGSALTFPDADVQSIRVQGGAGADTLSLTGGVFTFNTDVQADTPNLAITVGAGATVSFRANQRVAALTIGANGTCALAAGLNSVLVVSSLSIDPAGSLDVNDNAVIVKGGALGAWNPATSTYTGITGMLASAYKSGAWTGPGIRSTTASLEAQKNHGLGILAAQQAQDNGNPLTGGFHGQTVSGTDVLVQYGPNGDLNMDGQVNHLDYGVIDNAYLYNRTHQDTPERGYGSGDPNFDGAINYLDYARMDNAFLAANAPHAATAMAPAIAPAAGPALASLFSSASPALKPASDSSVLTRIDPGVL